MQPILEASRYTAMLAVVSLTAAAVGAQVGATFSTFDVIVHPVEHGGRPTLFSIELVALIDEFYLASALLLFAIGLYELFIGGLQVAEWLEVRNLYDSKTRLAGTVSLVMAVPFREQWIE